MGRGRNSQHGLPFSEGMARLARPDVMNRLPCIFFASLLGLVLLAGAVHLQSQESLSGDGKAKGDSAPAETLSGRPLAAGELARLPYTHLLRIAQSDARAKPDAASYKLRIQSRNPNVEPKDIKLFLDIKDKPLALVVDNDGFVEVPHRPDLVEGNPDLVANQPRGSLNIFVDLEVPKVAPPDIKEGKVAYQELFRPLVEIRAEMRKVDPNFGISPTDQQFILEIETGEEPVKITRALGSRTWRPNPRGKIYMVLETYLYEENPQVEVPDSAKINVIPASPEEIDEIRSR